jgi:hypothetical protein
VLRPLVDKDAILCTGGARIYQSFARATRIAHRAINVQQGIRIIDGAFPIQYVNAYDSSLKGWMQCFHGVAHSPPLVPYSADSNAAGPLMADPVRTHGCTPALNYSVATRKTTALQAAEFPIKIF